MTSRPEVVMTSRPEVVMTSRPVGQEGHCFLVVCFHLLADDCMPMPPFSYTLLALCCFLATLPAGRPCFSQVVS